MNILYEDAALVVLDKPAGLSSEEGVPAALRQLWGQPDAFVGVVHRLDTGVSGLMVFARTPGAAAALSRQITQSQNAYAVQDGSDGFPRGMHIEEGEPVFVNNPYVRSTLTNHVWGFTFFDNRSISFEKRDFTGKLKVGTKEYEYYSVNDTIVRLNGKPSYDANLYTFRYVKEPHPGLTNPIGTKALFIIGKNNQPLKVNSGDFEATITQIIDGRSTTVEAPYVIDKNEWVLQVTGDKANELAQSLKTGDKVQISAELKIGSSTDPIKVHNSSMYRYVYNGIYSAPPKKEDAETINPTTNLGMTQDKSKVIIFCVDGRTDNDRGLDFYEAYRVCKKLGLYDVIRFDGGGSTVMWTYENGIGNVINHVSDANGERSCMNYLHVRVLE